MPDHDEGELRNDTAPPAQRLADRLAPSSRWATAMPVLDDLARLDLAVYRAIAVTPTPALDEPMRRLSDLANNAKLWLAMAAVMGTVGGRAGRRAAMAGVAALAVNAAVVNTPIKLAGGRIRPDREAAGVPAARHVAMPDSPSFPSGHTASGFAFAAAVAGTTPAIAAPLRLLAAVVGYSRVHTGVHYPGDVVAGALFGTTIGESVALIARSIARRSHR
ncbi:MAG: phosphatase PAP2 family protein [Actinomycetota bacterium]